eukprot:599292-Heterocapsa_arctica.AAC.1
MPQNLLPRCFSYPVRWSALQHQRNILSNATAASHRRRLQVAYSRPACWHAEGCGWLPLP